MATMINLSNLPFVRFCSINKIPEISGIYFIITRHKEVLYIGQSQNIRSRIKTHNLKRVFISNRANRVAWIQCDNQERKIIESQMILGFSPMLNKIGKSLDSQDFSWYPQNHVIPGIGDIVQDRNAMAIAMDIGLL